MAHTPTVRHGGRSARTIHPTARLTLAAALCMLALPSNGRWYQEDHLFADDAAAGDEFGYSVGISGDTIVVGARDDNTKAGSDAGSAYVFTRTGSTWSQQGHLFADDAEATDWFGVSVAVDGDTIVVGAYSDDTAVGFDAGSAYVFTRTGGTWSQQDHLFADDAGVADYFGGSVAISGDTIVVGARMDTRPHAYAGGSAYVFTRTGSTWSQQDHLFLDDPKPYDYFGGSVAISGDTIVVGAYSDDIAAGDNAGAAYVFTRSGGAWSQQDHLLADDAAAGDWFGHSVAIDGDTIAVGSRYDDTAAGDNAGSAYVFTRSGGAWSQQDHLFADDAATDDWFGYSAAISGDTIVVGAYSDDIAAWSGAGSAYVFTRRGSIWSQQDHLFSDDAAENDRFSRSVAIDSDTIVVGEPFDDTAGYNAGSASVFGPPYFRIVVMEPELPSGY